MLTVDERAGMAFTLLVISLFQRGHQALSSRLGLTQTPVAVDEAILDLTPKEHVFPVFGHDGMVVEVDEEDVNQEDEEDVDGERV
jgi:hypothetical protein